MSQEKPTVQCECNPSRGFHCSKCWPHWLDPNVPGAAEQLCAYVLNLESARG